MLTADKDVRDCFLVRDSFYSLMHGGASRDGIEFDCLEGHAFGRQQVLRPSAERTALFREDHDWVFVDQILNILGDGH